MFKYSGRPWKYKNELDSVPNTQDIHPFIAAIKFVSLAHTVLQFVKCSFSCMGENCKYLGHYQMIHWFPAYFIIYSFLVFSGAQRALNIFGEFLALF